MSNKADGFDVDLSDSELAEVQRFAERSGLTIEEAASELASQRLQKMMRRKTRYSPARNVVVFRNNDKK